MSADKLDLVARNVRRFRHERGYSLSELARRAGLAKQTLSSLEGGHANPTVVTLGTIASALGIPVAHLLTEYGSPVLVRRAQDAAWTGRADGEVRELDQIYGFGYVRTALIRHTKLSDRPVEHQAHRPGTLHHAYVMRGNVRIGPAGEEVDVRVGDFIRFPGDVSHQTYLRSPTATLYMVTTVPHVAQIRAEAQTPHRPPVPSIVIAGRRPRGGTPQ